MQIFTQHAYIPETIITDKGRTFTSNIITEMMKTSGIKNIHATVKHAQTIGLVERSDQRLKQILKINVSADSPDWKGMLIWQSWHTILPTANHLSVSQAKCFTGRISFNALLLKFSNRLKCETTETDLAKRVDQVNEKYKQVNDNILQDYHKNKNNYDRKAQALPIKVNDFTFLLSSKIRLTKLVLTTSNRKALSS